MEQRRIEMWAADKKMQELNEQFAFAERMYNAAVSSGDKKLADEKKAEMELAKSMIKARQDLLPDDSFYREAISQLQVIIDSTKKNIDEDRAKTETLLTSLQQSFTQGQSVEKLPAEQKQLAADLQQKLDQINSARKTYNAAVDTSAADVDQQLKTQVTTLQTAIEARRKQLADENVAKLNQNQQESVRMATIEPKQQELAKLNAAEATARQAYFAKYNQFRDAQRSFEKLDSKIRKRDEIQRGLEGSLAQVDFKKQQVNHTVEPIKPDDKNVSVHAGEDRRLLYTLASGGSILLLFSVLILWTLHAASVEAPRGTLAAADLRPASVSSSDAAANGNGSNGSNRSNGKPDSDEEDHAPAVI
jgi:chromosome segregation ATPase